MNKTLGFSSKTPTRFVFEVFVLPLSVIYINYIQLGTWCLARISFPKAFWVMNIIKLISVSERHTDM